MKCRLIEILGYTLILFLFWLALCGTFEWPQLIVGLCVAIFVVFLNRDLLVRSDERPLVNLQNMLILTIYLLNLLWAIIISNFQVAWLVLNPRMPIEPDLVTLDFKSESITGRVLLANSITLTPGTLTVLIDDRKLLVHALTKASGESLQNWPLIAMIRKIEGV